MRWKLLLLGVCLLVVGCVAGFGLTTRTTRAYFVNVAEQQSRNAAALAQETPTATPETTPTTTPGGTPTATPQERPTATPEITPTATPEGTSVATPSPPYHKVHEIVQVGQDWRIVVTSVATQNQMNSIPASTGMTFLVLNVAMKNITTGFKTISPYTQFSLEDSASQKYTLYTAGATNIQGVVAPSNALSGRLVYQVSNSQKEFVLSYQEDTNQSGVPTLWKLTV